jgi:hypothetical protein
MKTIWKFQIPIQDEFELYLPYIHRVLLTALQDEKPMMWVEVDTSSSKNIPFKFFVEGTGHEIEPSTVHVGSWIQPPFVWHLYERYD